MLSGKKSFFILDSFDVVNYKVSVRVAYNGFRLGDVAVFGVRQPVTDAKFMNKSSLFVLLPGVIRRLELKPISEQNAEHLFVAPPYCQTACYVQPKFASVRSLCPIEKQKSGVAVHIQKLNSMSSPCNVRLDQSPHLLNQRTKVRRGCACSKA